MKKLLLLGAIALGAMTANAQNLKVTVHGMEIENGSTVDCNNMLSEYVEDEWDGVIETWYEYQLLPEVFVTSTVDTYMTVTMTNTTDKESVNLPVVPNLQICWPENCIPVGVGATVNPDGTLTANTPTDLQIDSMKFTDIPEEGFTLSCRILLTPAVGNPFSFNLNMIAEAGASVGGVMADEAAAEYYNLNGVRVANPDHGIFIVKKGNKVTKIVK